MMDEVLAGGRGGVGGRDMGAVGGGKSTVSPAFFTLQERKKMPRAYVEIYMCINKHEHIHTALIYISIQIYIHINTRTSSAIMQIKRPLKVM